MIEILKKIDSHPLKFLETDYEERKKVSPYVVNMWRFGASNVDSILVTNESLNLFLFSVKSKSLQEKLMLASGISNTRYKWYSGSGKNKGLSNEILQVVGEYLKCSPSEAAEFMKGMSSNDLSELMEEYGLETKKAKK